MLQSTSTRLPRLALGALAAGAIVVPLAPSTTAAAAETVLLDASAEWRYLDDDTDPAEGADPLSWTLADFDDAAWQTGSGGFGAKRGGSDVSGEPIDTEVALTAPGSEDDVRTYFFRTDVTIDEATLADLDALAATITYDDAAIVYVNGVEAARLNADGVTENLQYWGTGGGAPVTAQMPIDASLLHAGENTIAVAVYQDRPSSSDIYFRFDALANVEQEAAVTHVGLQIGADETERTIVWQSTTGSEEVAQVAPASALVDGALPDDATTLTPETGLSARLTTWHEATAQGLTPGEWAYRVGSDEGGWSEVYRFTVQDVSGDWSFIAAGDAQIGSSGDEVSDGEGWQTTLTTATAADEDAAFISSLGDQVESPGSTAEYDEFFGPDELRTTPFAVIDGNHDVASPLYSQHFAHPNASDLGRPASQTVGDYWYTMGDVLFLSLDSNSRVNDEHVRFLTETIEAHGADADWIVVQFHHSIYSVASHAEDSDILERREDLAPAFSEFGVDLVLMGHDHSYARTWLMEGTTPVAQESRNAAIVSDGAAIGDELWAEEGQVLYVTLNSSSGSKYYTPAEPTYDYVAAYDQSRTPSYAVVDVSDGRLTITTTQTLTGEIVDQVSLLQDAAAPELAVPGDTDVEQGTAFDALEGVSATDAVDGDLTEAVTVEGQVDTAQLGSTMLTYRVQDAAGNEAVAERVVTVVAAAPSEEPSGPGDDDGGAAGGDDDAVDDPSSGVDDAGASLPSTGGELAPWLVAAALALLAGGALLRSARRRRA